MIALLAASGADLNLHDAGGETAMSRLVRQRSRHTSKDGTEYAQ